MKSPCHVLLVTAPDCHLCGHARSVVQRLADEIPFTSVELSWHDPDAAVLVRRGGVPFPPALYVDGELWGYGRLSERALRRKFTARSATGLKA